MVERTNEKTVSAFNAMLTRFEYLEEPIKDEKDILILLHVLHVIGLYLVKINIEVLDW